MTLLLMSWNVMTRLGRRAPAPELRAPGDRGHDPDGPARNARITAVLGLQLLTVLLVQIGTVVFGVSQHRTLHETVGLLFAPLLLCKLASVTWRMVKYYTGVSAYRVRPKPSRWLRALGAILVASFTALVLSGLALAYGPTSVHSLALQVHNVAFYAGMAALAAHLYSHLVEAVRSAVVRSDRQPRASH